MNRNKTIETETLLIKGNIMLWENTMIQLSNVSCISTAPLDLMKFPLVSILFLIIGVALLEISTNLGFVFILGAVILIIRWLYTNDVRRANEILSVSMNSGDNLQIVFNDKLFLNFVLRVLEQIILEGGVGSKSVSINVHNCEIGGDAKILDNLNIS